MPLPAPFVRAKPFRPGSRLGVAAPAAILSAGRARVAATPRAPRCAFSPVSPFDRRQAGRSARAAVNSKLPDGARAACLQASANHFGADRLSRSAPFFEIDGSRVQTWTPSAAGGHPQQTAAAGGVQLPGRLA